MLERIRRTIPLRSITNVTRFAMPTTGMAKRVTFVIDRTGVIRKILTSIDTKNHDDQVLEVLKTLA